MNTTRQLQLRGTLTGRSGAGHEFTVQGEGNRVVIDSRNVRTGLRALSSLRYARVHGGLSRMTSPIRLLAVQAAPLEYEFRIGGRLVGRGGIGSRPNWLGRRLTGWPVELRAGAMVRAVVSAP